MVLEYLLQVVRPLPNSLFLLSLYNTVLVDRALLEHCYTITVHQCTVHVLRIVLRDPSSMFRYETCKSSDHMTQSTGTMESIPPAHDSSASAWMQTLGLDELFLWIFISNLRFFNLKGQEILHWKHTISQQECIAHKPEGCCWHHQVRACKPWPRPNSELVEFSHPSNIRFYIYPRGVDQPPAGQWRMVLAQYSRSTMHPKLSINTSISLTEQI